MSDDRTRNLRPGATFPARLSAAYRDGQATAAAREPRVNPWPGDADDPRDRVLSMTWARGYRAGHPIRS